LPGRRLRGKILNRKGRAIVFPYWTPRVSRLSLISTNATIVEYSPEIIGSTFSRILGEELYDLLVASADARREPSVTAKYSDKSKRTGTNSFLIETRLVFEKCDGA
jgi:hypothetical protein